MGTSWRVSGPASAVVLLACACTPTRPMENARERSSTVDDHVRVTANATTTDLPVITTMRTRDREVVVFASSNGLRFTVRDDSGEVLAERFSHAMFLAAFPTLGQHFDTAFAGETTWLDASVGLPVLPEK
jgi:hypothetical protein